MGRLPKMFRPLKEEPEYDLGAVGFHLHQYTDDTLEFIRDEKPRFVVPVLRGEDGKLRFDLDNVDWVDEATDEEKAATLKEAADLNDLDLMFQRMAPYIED